MRDVFSEYYLPDDDEEAVFLREAVVVVDTNVLLSLYRMTSHERDQQLDALTRVADRLWIPYQVGWEFQRNRMRVIKERAGIYGTLEEVPSAGTAETMRNRIRGLKLPDDVTAEIEELLGPLTTQLHEAVVPFAERVRELAAQHVIDPAVALRSDPVRDRLDALFAGRVGPPPADTVRTSRVEEARERTARKEPPGYKDQGKGDDLAMAGDYLLWAELLDHAQSMSDAAQPFLFVTGDEKEDWFVRDNDGRPVGPRTELVAEFKAINPHGYHQITHARFLTLAQQHLGATVDADTIARVDSIAREAAAVDLVWTDAPDGTPASAAWLLDRARRQMGSEALSMLWSTDDHAHLDGAARRWSRYSSDEALRDPTVGSGASWIQFARDASRSNAGHEDMLNPSEAYAVHRIRNMLAGINGAPDLVSNAYYDTAAREYYSDGETQPVEGHPEVSAAFVEAVAVAAAFVPQQEAAAFIRSQIETAHPNLASVEKQLLTGLVFLRASVSGRRSVDGLPAPSPRPGRPRWKDRPPTDATTDQQLSEHERMNDDTDPSSRRSNAPRDDDV